MNEVEQWAAAVDEVVDHLLAGAGLEQPPVDALRLAGCLGIDVVLDHRQLCRGRHKRVHGRSAIFLRPESRPERLQWAAAHELGEVCVHRVFTRLQLLPEEPSAGLREQTANLLASRLLLPSRWFWDDLQRLDGDLLLLKRRYATASHELIALRLLDDRAPAAVSIFDQQRLTRRRVNATALSGRLTLPERACWREVRRQGRPVTLAAGPVCVRGWPVNEQGWRREILWAACAADS